MLEKNERKDNKGLQYGTVQYNTDSANLARIPVFLETIIMETRVVYRQMARLAHVLGYNVKKMVILVPPVRLGSG